MNCHSKIKGNRMSELEDILLQLKFDTDRDDYKQGQLDAIRFCVRKHGENWTLEDFKHDLEKAIKLNLDKEYIKGIVSGLKYNIKLMEGIK